MGKKDKKKKDPEKKAAIAAKKEAKAEKAALKRLKKELGKTEGQDKNTNDNNDDDDFDAILASYNEKNKNATAAAAAATSTPMIESLSDPQFPFPPTRANFSFTYASTSGEIYLFGGEYYNGVENIVYDDLFKYNPDARPATYHENPDMEKGSKIEEEDDHQHHNNNNSGSSSSIRMGEWKKIISPAPTPPARCAHSSVFYNNAIYIFGGELATASQFHHYRDLWKFDITKNTWEEITVKRSGGGSGSPSPRSGHRCIVWRHYMILFGGFYEALKETKWFQDLWVFDFATSTWTEMKYGKLATLPDPRSAFSFGIHPSTDTAFLYGGFSKLKNPGKSDETKVHSDCWALHLKPLIGGGGSSSKKVPTWERLKRKGSYPTPSRSGMGHVIHKQRLLLFGGVNDTEKDGHKLESIFYENLYAFEMEKKRWFELGMKKKKDGNSSRRRKKKGGTAGDDKNQDCDDDNVPELKEDESSSTDDDDNDFQIDGGNNGWDLEKLRSNMFAFIDGDGNVVYEKIEDEDADKEKAESNEGYEADQGETDELMPQESNQKNEVELTNKEEVIKYDETATEEENKNLPDSSTQNKMQKANVPVDASRVLKLNSQGKPTALETPTPLPRINASLAVKNNTLYLYGGLLEVGDRELTLDDCWSIDLQKREQWQCLWRGTMHQQVWKGVDSDLDEASYISTGDDGMHEFGDSDLGEGEDFGKDDDEAKAKKEARKAAKKEARKKEKSSIRAEISDLRSQLDLDDQNRTPHMGEAIADFYSRTSEYWNEQATIAKASNTVRDDEKLTNKEMKREGFLLAKKRYEELKPALERLNELEEMQTSAETNRKKKKDKDKNKRSDGRKKDRRH